MFGNAKFAIVAAAASLCIAGQASAAIQDVDVMNNSGETILAVYLSPEYRPDWGRDLLGNEILEDGWMLEKRFNRDQGYCTYDVMVTFSDGSKMTKADVDLCTVSILEVVSNRIRAY